MNPIEVLLIALSMAMDAFAVSLGIGAAGRSSGPRPTFRLAYHFGLFQFIMPVIGWIVGATIEPFIAAFDHWVAFGLLALVGARMIRSGLDPDGEPGQADPSRGFTLILLSVAVSIDALAIGLSLGLIGVFVWYPAIVIGVVTGLLSLAGLRIGNGVGRKFGKRMELFGGIVLLLIGLRIVLTHTFSP